MFKEIKQLLKHFLPLPANSHIKKLDKLEGDFGNFARDQKNIYGKFCFCKKEL